MITRREARTERQRLRRMAAQERDVIEAFAATRRALARAAAAVPAATPTVGSVDAVHRPGEATCIVLRAA